MAEEFDLLAAKALSGEATADELARFEQILSADAERRAEFEELRTLWPQVKELAPLTQALDAPPEQPPAERERAWLERIERTLGNQRRERVRITRFALALAAVIVVAALVSLLSLRGSRETGPLRIAMTKPPAEMRSLLISTRDGKAFPIYAPAGFTAEITPMIVWKALPGRTYDVSIGDDLSAAAQLFRASGVSSPLDFNKTWPRRTLARDGLYRLRISETGKALVVSELTFRVLPQGTSPAAARPLDRAYEMLAASPPRIGDALAILLTLPPELANSDRALRLKAFAFGQLGYADDFEATLAQLGSR